MAVQDSKRLESSEHASPPFLLIRLLLGCAILVDAYLAGVSLTQGSVAGCGPESNCHVVLNSRWAYWFGLPVSTAGLLVYGCLFAGTFLTGAQAPADKRRKVWQMMILCSALTLGAGLWFVCLQLFVLKTICPYCMTAHGCAMLAAGLTLYRAPIRRAPEQAKQRVQQVYVPPGLAMRLYLAAGVAVAILVAGQTLTRPTAYASVPISAGVATNVAAPTVREFQIFDGQFRFNLNEVPLLGRPDAPHTIVSLFDYTCHHCREVHGPLMEAHRRFSNELSIVNLPMPLDGKCNPIVKRTQPAHTNACALARIGLAVWLANRRAATAFDDWIFEPAHPPEPAVAEKHARVLVGSNAFDRAFTNRWIDEQIRQDVAVYEAVYRRYRKGYMPEVIIGTNLLSGVFNRDQLFKLLSDQLGLKTTP